ncbi:hypothetical protein J8273_7074 [Carpediemonas membranifera]|uniref:Uncharacterized protein n=1 Tax=Carpediemonas membranifera TaxID=201153 RepID=A0A8J6ARZ9_9EUKA|nr:hypothetical protein J8273_7074 [Carpediemonas membranifera]|eukprot:KAG9390815.1 hypothetical protein J8273_7074 [Carpediemonas membranifera]
MVDYEQHCKECSCTAFEPHPFKKGGFCRACFHRHPEIGGTSAPAAAPAKKPEPAPMVPKTMSFTKPTPLATAPSPAASVPSPAMAAKPATASKEIEPAEQSLKNRIAMFADKPLMNSSNTRMSVRPPGHSASPSPVGRMSTTLPKTKPASDLHESHTDSSIESSPSTADGASAAIRKSFGARIVDPVTRKSSRLEPVNPPVIDYKDLDRRALPASRMPEPAPQSAGEPDTTEMPESVTTALKSRPRVANKRRPPSSVTVDDQPPAAAPPSAPTPAPAPAKASRSRTMGVLPQPRREEKTTKPAKAASPSLGRAVQETRHEEKPAPAPAPAVAPAPVVGTPAAPARSTAPAAPTEAKELANLRIRVAELTLQCKQQAMLLQRVLMEEEADGVLSKTVREIKAILEDSAL